MTPRPAADELVLFQSDHLNVFKRSLVTSVVCEFRFPTLMELGESKPPSNFVKALRKSYPQIEVGTDVSFGLGGAAETSHAHVFRSMRGNWAVSLKHSNLTIETSSYTGYDELRRRVLEVVEAAVPVIDTDFWTRVGLRYVNTLPGRHDPVSNSWINPALLLDMKKGCFRGISEVGSRLLLNADDGGCLLQTGLKRNPPSGTQFVAPDFVIDVDSFRTEVALSDTKNRLENMHAQAFNLFDWALDGSARSYLSGEGEE